MRKTPSRFRRDLPLRSDCEYEHCWGIDSSLIEAPKTETEDIFRGGIEVGTISMSELVAESKCFDNEDSISGACDLFSD